MNIDFSELLTVTFTLFAVIDILGAIPILISLKEKMGGINELKATLISGVLMILFLFAGKAFLNLLGLDVRSFAVGGSIVIFILGLEMVLGLEFFKSEKDIRAATVVPIAFPLIALCGLLLVIDLHRPERFSHMLFKSEVLQAAFAQGFPFSGAGWRLAVQAPAFKYWSPMSAGSWGLTLFGVCAFASFVAAPASRFGGS